MTETFSIYQCWKNRHCFQFTSLCYGKSKRLLKHLVHYTLANPFRFGIPPFSIGPLCLYPTITVTLFIYRRLPSILPRSMARRSPFFPVVESRTVPSSVRCGRTAPSGTTFTPFAIAPGVHHANVPLKGKESFASPQTRSNAEIYFTSVRKLCWFIFRLEIMF